MLHELGHRTWRDVRSLDPDEDLSGEIEAALRTASRVVVCLTAEVAQRSPSFVRREIACALARKVPLVPLVFPGGELILHRSLEVDLTNSTGSRTSPVDTMDRSCKVRTMRPEAWPLWEATFAHWASVIGTLTEDSEQRLAVWLRFAEDPRGTALAHCLPRRRGIEIEVADTLVGLVDRSLDECAAIACSVLFGEPTNQIDPVLVDLGRRCLDEQAISFAVLHELAHAGCGHHSLHSVVGQPPFGIAESEIALRTVADHDAPSVEGASSSPVAIDDATAYYLEVEADNTALQLQMQAVPPPATSRLLELLAEDGQEPRTAICELYDGRARDVAFRALLIGQWIVTRIVEWHRARVPSARRSHPFPGSRLLSGWMTLLAQFAEVTDETTPGSGSYRLTEEQAGALRHAVQELLRPLLVARWPAIPELPALTAVTDDPVGVLRDLARELFGHAPQSEAGRQLRELVQDRARMAERLAPHRYFPGGR